MVPVSNDGVVGYGPCPECRNRQWQERIQKLQEISGLSKTHQLLTLNDIDLNTKTPRSKVVVEQARQFIQDPSSFMTVYGPYGNGKTTMLMSVVNECIARGVPSVYITFADMIGYARAAFSTQNESDWDRINQLASVPVLCIDEMSPDQIKETEYVRMIQSKIINARYIDSEAGVSGTIVAGNFCLFNESSNLPTLPDWISSRLKQGVMIWNDDPDFRPQLGRRL